MVGIVELTGVVGVSEYLEVVELSKRMRAYFENAINAIVFFTFGMLIAAYFLVLAPFPQVWKYWPLVLAGLIALIIIAVNLVHRALPQIAGTEDGKWIVSFLLPLPVYAIPALIGFAILSITIWYLWLGIALLLVYLLFGKLDVYKPFLLASAGILLTYPAVLYLTLVKGEVAAAFATGLMLAFYYAAGAYALRRAHKALTAKGGSRE